MKKPIDLKNNKTKAIIAAIMIVGVIGTVTASSYMIEYVNAQAKNIPTNPLGAIQHFTPQTPAATMSQGLASEVLGDLSLSKISEHSKASRPDPSNPQKNFEDSGVTATLNYNKSGDLDTVAITVTNTSVETVYVYGLVISGFIHGDFDSAIESVYRPIISDPYDVVGATTTEPQAIPPGQSFTAYIQDELFADGYGGLVCYSYVKPISTEVDDAAETSSRDSSYCISLPLTWLK